MQLSVLFLAVSCFSLILSGCGSDSSNTSDTLPLQNTHLDYSLKIEGNGSLTGVWLLATDTRSETFKATENQSGNILTAEEGSGYFKQVFNHQRNQRNRSSAQCLRAE